MPGQLPGEPIALDQWKQRAFAGEVPAGVLLRKSFETEVREVTGLERALDFAISSGRVDREGDIVSPLGGDWSGYLQGGPGPVLLCHDYHSLPVAACPELRADGDRIVARAVFPSNSDLGLAEGAPSLSETVFRMVKGRWGLKSASIGFRPIKYAFNADRGSSDGWHTPVDFLQWEGLEWSIVPVPANPDAVVLMAASGIAMEPIWAWARCALDSSPDLAVVERAKLEAVVAATGNGKGLAIFDLGAEEFGREVVQLVTEPTNKREVVAQEPPADIYEDPVLDAEAIRQIVRDELAAASEPKSNSEELGDVLAGLLGDPAVLTAIRQTVEDEFTARTGALPD